MLGWQLRVGPSTQCRGPSLERDQPTRAQVLREIGWGWGREKPRESHGNAADGRRLPYNASRVVWVRSPRSRLVTGSPEATASCPHRTR